jgi:hypothetical protein
MLAPPHGNTAERRQAMWDTVVESTTHLSHEMPCPWCRHSVHRYLPCSDRCDCGGIVTSYDVGEPLAGR